MALDITIEFEPGDTVHYIATCQSIPNNKKLITVRSAVVREIRTVTKGDTTVIFYVLENDVENDNSTDIVEQSNTRGSLEEAVDLLRQLLTETPQ